MTADAALAAAQPLATGAAGHDRLADRSGADWKIAFAREGGPAEVAVADAERQWSRRRARRGPRPMPG